MAVHAGPDTDDRVAPLFVGRRAVARADDGDVYPGKGLARFRVRDRSSHLACLRERCRCCENDEEQSIEPPAPQGSASSVACDHSCACVGDRNHYADGEVSSSH